MCVCFFFVVVVAVAVGVSFLFSFSSSFLKLRFTIGSQLASRIPSKSLKTREQRPERDTANASFHVNDLKNNNKKKKKTADALRESTITGYADSSLKITIIVNKKKNTTTTIIIK